MTYNYANFTTNSLGEASVLIMVGEPSLPSIHALPKGWVVVTILDNGTENVHFNEDTITPLYNLEWNEEQRDWNGVEFTNFITRGGVLVIPLEYQANNPHSRIGIRAKTYSGYSGYSVYSPDADGCADVVVYVTPP